MTIQYYRQNVYGNELIYLVESLASLHVLYLIGQKTINERQIDRFEQLGITFEEVLAPRKEMNI